MSPLLVTLFGIILAIRLSICGRTDDYIQQSEVCTTRECHQVANAFQASMNKSLDPCVNFYDYVCGHWETAYPKPKYVRIWSNMARLSMLARTRLRDMLRSEPSSEDISPIQKIKKFYKSCMDEETRESEELHQIDEILQETRGWPMIMSIDEWNKNAMPWQDIDDYYQSFLGDSGFFEISTVMIDRLQNYVLTIYSPTFYPDEYENRSDYRSLIKNTAQAFIRWNNIMVSHEQLEEDIDNLIKLEEKLHEISSSFGTTRIVTDLDSFIGDWNEKTKYTPQSRIKWKEVFERIFAITGLRPTTHTGVRFENMEYFIELAHILQSTNKRIIVNFIQWKFLSMTLPDTTKEMEDLFNKIQNEDLSIEERPRWLNCVERLGVNHASYYLFIKEYYQLDSWKAAHKVFSTVAGAYKTLVQNSNWMSRRAKIRAARKLETISARLGYSKFYDNEKNIIDYYEDVCEIVNEFLFLVAVEIMKSLNSLNYSFLANTSDVLREMFLGQLMTIGDNYFDNILEFISHSWKSRIKYWGEKRKSRQDFDDPLTMTAEYWHECNFLVMTPAFLQSPLIDGTLPDYITYGTLGSIMGHEVSHALNYEDLTKMLDTEEQRTFDEVIGCFIGLFEVCFSISDLSDSSPVCSNASMRAQFTLEENLADWRGVQAGFRAYQKMKDEEKRDEELKLPGFKEFSDEQMFFISWTQMWCGEKDDDPEDCHSPDYIRALATLSHNADFAEAFNCPRNYPMNPQRKCKFWMK